MRNQSTRKVLQDPSLVTSAKEASSSVSLVSLSAMPRKRRPTPPLPGSIVRNLAPKPDPSPNSTHDSSDKTAVLTSSSSRQSTTGSDLESSYCGVPQCNTLNCRLQTHINYGRQRKLALLQSSRASGLPISSSSTSSTGTTLQLPMRPNMDSTLRLPIEDTPNREFQTLFVYFFNSLFDGMVLIFRPQLNDPAFKQTVYRLALHNPVYCLTLVAQAHMSIMKDSDAALDSAGDTLTDTIYTRLLKMTREKIEHFDLVDVDILLMAIVVLCEYDLLLHQYDALGTHHNGMKALVTKRGGIHNLGLSLPYVLRMDRFLAIRSNQLPQFASLDTNTLNVAAQMDEESIYGTFFQGSPPGISDHVRSVCADSAGLLELMDDLGITFDPATIPDTANPKIEYFYFVRENIEVRYAVLNHQHNRGKTNTDLNRLSLYAAQLVTYYVAEKNYLPLVTNLLSTRLWNMLTNSPTDSPQPSPSKRSGREAKTSEPSTIPTIDLAKWKNNMPILLWLLFACFLPSSRATTMTFAGHLSSALSSPGSSRSPATSASKRSSPSQSSSTQSIMSPSSPRRQRYLPSFILYVAEHLVGERPLSGTSDWETKVVDILEEYVWAGDRLAGEFHNIMRRIHECVVARAEEEDEEED